MRYILRSSLGIILGVNLFAAAVFASWAYSFVINDDRVYTVSAEQIDSQLIGAQIGKVTQYSDDEQVKYSGNFSNSHKAGTKYYEIKGIASDEAIAVQESGGRYVKAVYSYTREAEKTPVQLMYKYLIALVLLSFLIMAFIPMRRSRKQQQ